MKNSKIIIMFFILFTLFIYLVFNVFNFSSIDKKVTNNTWYRYDRIAGYYEILNINEDSFSYNISQSLDENNYINCSRYTFNASSQTLKLDCKKNIRVAYVDDKKLVLFFENEEKVFFTDINNSLNYEFESYFKLSVAEYSDNKSHVKNLVKVNKSKLYEIYNDKEESLVAMIGNNCINVDCILFMDILEQWIALTENVYFIDSTTLTEKDSISFNKLNSNFSKNINDYNLSYPLIFRIKNKVVLEQFEIKCTGFNCSKYKIN